MNQRYTRKFSNTAYYCVVHHIDVGAYRQVDNAYNLTYAEAVTLRNKLNELDPPKPNPDAPYYLVLPQDFLYPFGIENDETFQTNKKVDK